MTEEFSGYSTENPGGVGDELLPCPFCGGKPIIKEEFVKRGKKHSMGFRIYCENEFSCRCEMINFYEKSIAIDKWNTRVKSPSNGLVPLEENKVFEIVRANNNTFVSDTDCRYISNILCYKFGVKASNGLVPLNKQSIYEIKECLMHYIDDDKDIHKISHLISKFGVKAPSISVEEIENIIKEVRLLGNYKASTLMLPKEINDISQAIHSAITGEK